MGMLCAVAVFALIGARPELRRHLPAVDSATEPIEPCSSIRVTRACR